MRELRAQNRVCDRAREYSSRSLDGELSDFERALLDTHLERCDACRTYAAELAEIVTRLRTAPLEALPHPIALPSRRRVRTRSVLQGAAAAAAAVVAVTAGLVGSLQSHPTQARPNQTLSALIRADDFNSGDVQLMHQFRAAAQAPKKALVLARDGQKQQ